MSERLIDSVCPHCGRLGTTVRVVKHEDGFTKLSRTCTSCGGEWVHTFDHDWLAVANRRRLEAEVERLRRAHQAACEGGDLLREEIERLTRERDEARAVVERLTEWQSINHSEQHKLGWSMTEFCEGKRDHLHEMWERPPSLDYGIAHIEAEIKRLRAHNARLRAQVSEYFSERETHPVEDV